jgi:hypothetical protein
MEPTTPVQSKTWLLGIIIPFLLICGALYLVVSSDTTQPPTTSETQEVPVVTLGIPSDVSAEVAIKSSVRSPFSIQELSNIDAIEKEFGITFSAADKKHLETHKFILKPLTQSTLAPVSVGENLREFFALYDSIGGPTDMKERTLAHAPFISSDVLMHLFSVLSVELLKETENTYLFAQVRSMTRTLYADADAAYVAAKTDTERARWAKVRAYFAVPHALLSVATVPPSPEEYWKSNHETSYEDFFASYKKKDESADTRSAVKAYVRSLKLDAASERAVLHDIDTIYDAPPKAVPAIFADEYQALAGDIDFSVPFSLFTVRGTYTSSSLRRQYFRAVQWYQQIPFFTRSTDLSEYSIAIGTLMNNHPELLSEYSAMGDLLKQLVGESDDLDAGDFARAVKELEDDVHDEAARAAFLATAKPAARIKGLPAFYSSVGIVTMKDVIDKTRGMRFFSQKFIPDSYWTGRLTQGDEAPEVDGMKLPRTASSVQVMTILGSDYARSQLGTLPFYPTHKQAIDTRLSELTNEAHDWGADYWKKNQVTGILSSIATLFSWQQKHVQELPAFMQSPLWGSKSLMTASGFWTELRHTNILYAKQSFAEKGGGGDDGTCDTRVIPEPVYGYVEPQPAVYAQLIDTAEQLAAVYRDRALQLQNAEKLQTYIALLRAAHEYATLQLADTAFTETTLSRGVPLENDPQCVQNYIDPSVSVKRPGVESVMNADKQIVAALSRAEDLRRGLITMMLSALPLPVEGPILPIKDKRAAVVADIHTSDEGIVEEGTGVPFLIFVAVKDANGPRLTTGLTYSHYEFLSDTRLTDEAWQQRFYTESGDYQITYTPYTSWPKLPVWYQPLISR